MAWKQPKSNHSSSGPLANPPPPRSLHIGTEDESRLSSRRLKMAGLSKLSTALPVAGDGVIVLPETQPSTIAPPLPDSFLSYSIEFAFFPDFAGNASHPNTFTKNILASLTSLQGSPPLIRVGGNTQDKTTFHPTQDPAIINVFDEEVSLDYPATVNIGPAYFESYANLPNTKFIHGFNMALGGNSSAGLENVLQHAVTACDAIGETVLAWEFGNEADMFAKAHDYRPSNYDEAAVFAEWRKGTEAINMALKEHCSHKYFAPSFAGIGLFMDPLKAWRLGYDKQTDIYSFIQHQLPSNSYLGVATEPGLTLRNTLLNHTRTTASIANHTRLMTALDLPPNQPYILGETNSLARQGLPLVSDTFGAALWNPDFALHVASVGIHRIHMYQGVNYRYASWQPIETERGVLTTKPAFYGNAATADFVRREKPGQELRVLELELEPEVEAGYVGFVDGRLERLAVVNLRGYNASDGAARPEQRYEFVVPAGVTVGRVKRLTASGSDAYSGATYGGVSYNVELDEGRPVRLDNVTDVESVPVRKDGKLSITVPDASGVVVRLEY